MRDKTARVMMLGDVSGSAGMGALFLGLSSFVREKGVDIVIANGENAAGGFGISEADFHKFRAMGIDVITSGNHIWQKDDILPVLDREDTILRPLNYPEPCSGRGWTVRKKGDIEYAVINAQGRMMMNPIDDPFKRISEALREIGRSVKVVLVDFHAESAEEKEAVAFFLDGKVSAVVGTHTHVQTADEKILPKGTAYITDLGITGVIDAVIGSSPAKSIERQLTQLPIRSEVSEGEGHMQGVSIDIDTSTGKALAIERCTR